jgi:hypothetical protein
MLYAALRLNQRCLAGNGDCFGQRAQFDRHRADDHAVARTDCHVPAFQRLEPVDGHPHRVGVRQHAGEYEVPVPAVCVSIAIPRL